MRNFLQADLKRLMRRVPLMIAILGMFIIHVAVVCYSYSRKSSASSFLGAATTSFEILGIIMVIVEFGAIFNDFMNANVMQVAIGRGISRRRIVLFKYLEIAIVMCFNLLVLTLLNLILNPILGARLEGSQIRQLLILFVTSWIQHVGLLSFAMIPIFGFFSPTAGLILYIALAADLDKGILMMLKQIKGLEMLTLENYTFSSLENALASHLYLGTFSVSKFIPLVVYIVIAIFVSVRIFKKKELAL
ncbi:MAG: hypothetical protein Q4B26_00575 [Eubacteriales bacterium]|nr:hypothetical protein [Eubacteriales bacterium]